MPYSAKSPESSTMHSSQYLMLRHTDSTLGKKRKEYKQSSSLIDVDDWIWLRNEKTYASLPRGSRKNQNTLNKKLKFRRVRTTGEECRKCRLASPACKTSKRSTRVLPDKK